MTLRAERVAAPAEAGARHRMEPSSELPGAIHDDARRARIGPRAGGTRPGTAERFWWRNIDLSGGPSALKMS